jgi:hypothetical protein
MIEKSPPDLSKTPFLFHSLNLPLNFHNVLFKRPVWDHAPDRAFKIWMIKNRV